MKKILKVEHNGDTYKISRTRNKDKISIQRWGDVWFKFEYCGGVVHGQACIEMLHAYLPKPVMSEVVKNWPKDFKEGK